MQRRTLGRTGLCVSEIGFGSVEIGTEYGIQVDSRPNRPDPEQAVRIVRRALDLGVNVIDTARTYGESERIIGQALDGRRESVVLMTKIDHINPDQTGSGLISAIDESLRTSLQLLRTDVIDVCQMHSPTTELIRRGEIVTVLERFRTEGRIRFVGTTVYSHDEALAALDDPRIDVIQIAYSLLDASMDHQVIPLAAQRGVGVVARSVLHRGVLTSKGASGSDQERRLHEVASSFGFLFDDETTSLPHAAMRFVLSNDQVSCALVGMDSLEQVEQNLSYGPIRPFSARQVCRVRESAPPDPWAIRPRRYGSGSA